MWPRRSLSSVRYSWRVFQPVHVHHRGRLGQGQRQAVEILAEVERLDPLTGVVDEPGAEIGQRFPPTEPADRHDPQGAPAYVPSLRAVPLKVVPGSRVVMTTRPPRPDGHSPARSATSARSSRTSAHRRSVRASQAAKRPAAACASASGSGSPAPTAVAAWANPARTASRVLG